ncbi:MAG: NAD(P)H-dependent oxidoreductase [Candidatus Odinarchaeota archaeon]
MKKILGVVGSYRKQGNTELFIKLALREAEKHGVKTEMIRLTDFTFDPCRGCLSCVFKASRCRIPDDFYPFLELLEQADGVLFGSPTYLLGPQGQYKLIIDRFLLIPQHIANLQGKPSLTVTASGLAGWNSLSPMLNMLPLGFGMKLLDSVHVYGPGPGQAVLDEKSRQKAVEAGKKLALAVKGENFDQLTSETPDHHCPVCRGELFTPIGTNQLECALCNTRATITEDLETAQGFRLVFDPDSLTAHRWTEEALVHHMEEWVKATEQMYFGRLEEIKQLKSELKPFDRWVPGKQAVNTASEEDEIYTIPPEKKITALQKLLLAWDGQWFLNSLERFGYDAASEVNALTRATFGKIEMRELLKVLGKEQADDPDDAVKLLKTYGDLFSDQIAGDYQVTDGGITLNVTTCPAFEKVKRARDLGLTSSLDQACIACRKIWHSWISVLLPRNEITVVHVKTKGEGESTCDIRIKLV